MAYKEKIKQEIERLKGKVVDDCSLYSNGWKQSLRLLKKFIDSLQEEPAIEDLEKEINEPDSYPREGLVNIDDVCDFIEENIDNYLFINMDWNEPQLKTNNFIEDIRRSLAIKNGSTDNLKEFEKIIKKYLVAPTEEEIESMFKEYMLSLINN